MAPNVHQSQAPLLGMLTGPLISRMSPPSKAFVAALLVVEDDVGMMTADELVFIWRGQPLDLGRTFCRFRRARAAGAPFAAARQPRHPGAGGEPPPAARGPRALP